MTVVNFETAPGTGALFVTSSIANPLAPKVTEFASPNGWKLGFEAEAWEPKTEQGKSEFKRYSLPMALEAFGQAKTTIEDLLVTYNPQNMSDPKYVAATKFVENSEHWVFDRRGKDASIALAIGDLGVPYKLKIGRVSQEVIKNDDGEVHQLRIPIVCMYVGTPVAMVA